MKMYRCPKCKTFSRKMNIISRDHGPTKAQIKRDPWFAQWIGREVLECQCGMILTWFSMEEVDEAILSNRSPRRSHRLD